jgi:RHS repeat-associated protein
VKKIFRLSLFCFLFLFPGMLHAATPTITALTLIEGPTEGASYVGIIGTGFTKDTVFRFDNERVIFKRFIDSTKAYVLTVEHMAEGAVDVSATNSDGTGIFPSAFTFKNSSPSLNQINLDNGVTEGNTSIQFYGRHFTSDLRVMFGEGESVVRCFYHSRSMKCYTPPHITGTVDVVVSNTHGIDTITNGFTYHDDPPAITRISPESGVTQGGTLVKIWGRNFRASDTWDFGGSPAGLQTLTSPCGKKQILDSNLVSVLTTSHEDAEPVSVSVTSRSGTTTVDDLFTYTTDPPEIRTISPNKGFPEGGSTTWIFGNNFTGNMIVDFGGAPAAITKFRNTSLVRVRTSAHDKGLVGVTATTPNGSASNYGCFTYLDTIPTTNYLWPNNGVVDGNSYVTVRGRNFKESGTTVFFGDIEQNDINVLSSNSLRLRTTSSPIPGAVDVHVITDEGEAILENGFVYTEAKPTITRVYPLQGLTSGNQRLFIYGNNFTGNTVIKLDNVEHTLDRFYHSGRIRIRTLAHETGKVDVTVENERGASILEKCYEYVEELPPENPEGVPFISYLTPAKGPKSGGTLITIVGENFSDEMTVLLDSEPANVQRYYSDTKILILTPAVSAPGPVDITVSDEDGSTTLTDAFAYTNDPPVINTIIPSHGFVYGGTYVTVYGSHFSKDIELRLGGIKAVLDRFYHSEAARFQTAPGTEGSCDVTVTTPYGSTTLSEAYTYAAYGPQITKTNPNHGPPPGGNTVSITGSYFAPYTRVYFGEVEAIDVRYHNTRSISVPAPQKPPETTPTVDITVATTFGRTTDPDAYTYDTDAPTVTISAYPESVQLGQSSTLTWDSTDAGSCVIEPGIGSVDVDGSISVSPTETTTYTITATGPGGSATDNVTVTVTNPHPTVNITTEPETIQIGESATLSWTSSHADFCVIEPGIGSVDLNGSITVSPSETTTYSITATGSGGTAMDSVTVIVTHPQPTVDISANPETVLAGESSTLSWNSTSADSAGIDNGIGNVPVNGSTPVSPTQTTTYTITVTGPGGTATDSVKVIVIVPPEDTDHGLNADEQEGGGGLVGETIRIITGNGVESRSDISIASPNRIGLSFNAFYNSRSDRIGSIGYGWTHTYDINLDPAVDIGGKTYVRIIDKTGKAHYFQEETAGVYKGTFKERSHVKTEAGSYVWKTLDGTQYCFSGSGKLSCIEDRNRNRIEIGYDTRNRLENVTDTASSRMLTFHYNGDNRISHISGPVTDAVPEGIWVTYAYDADQNLTSVSYADGSGFNYTYTDPNDIHNLTEKRDKLNHLLKSFTYDTQDRVTDNFCVEGRGVSISYVSATEIEVADSYGTLRTYTLSDIDGRKRVTAMSGIGNAQYSENNAVGWEYDTEMRLTEVEYKGGTINQYQDYDERDNPGTVKLAVGTPDERVILYTYHPDINVPLTRTEASVLVGGNKVTVWDYDDNYDAVPNENPTHLLSRIIEQGFTKNPAGSIIPYEYISTFTYNTKGQVLSIDGPKQGTDDTTSFAYNSQKGNLLSITSPLIGPTNFSDYDNAGYPGRIEDVNGQEKTFSYDGRSRITAITNHADGSTTNIIYNTAGQPQSVTDPDTVNRTFSYDTDYGRLTKITDMEGNYIAYSYDAQGNRTEMGKNEVSGTRTYTKRWDYQHPDMPGKLFKEVNADDTFTRYDYDSEGNIASMTDNKGHTTEYLYDPLNRLIEVTQPGNVVTSYFYDTHGNLISVTDGEGHDTEYHYDDMGRVISTISPDTGTVTHVYDEVGNLIEKTDEKGIIVEYTYDILNRLIAVHFPDSTQDITYTYDAGTYGMGRPTGITDQSGSMTFSYDTRGRLVEKTSIINGHNYTTGTSYSPGNRVMSVTYPSARTVDYNRDSMGRMQGLSTTYDANTVTLVSNMTYNPFGNPKGMGTGSGGAVNNVSSECGYITIANPGQPMERIFAYDANGNLTSIQGTNTPWYNQNFGYDALNRLISAEGMYGTVSYTYDRVGNRLTRMLDDDTETYSYLPGTNKLDRITVFDDPMTFAYDANGNIIGMDNKVLSYNQNNRLVRVEEDGDILGEYTYNGLGQRVIKAASGVTTVYHYDLNGKLIAEGNSDGTITKEYLYMGKIRMAVVDVTSGEMYYYLNDRLGTPLIMTDDTGTVVWEAYYNPFGDANINPNSTIVNNIRFPGQYYDEETGLHYNYHRYYDPRTGRYLTPDPIGLVGGINLYCYAVNNPVNWIDPLGLYRYPPGTMCPIIKCDWQELADCINDRLKHTSPDTILQCLMCAATRGMQQEACATCLSDSIVGIGECYTDYCQVKYIPCSKLNESDDACESRYRGRRGVWPHQPY